MCCICWKMLFRKILVSRPTCGLEFLPRFALNEKSTSTLARAQRKSSTMCFASFILACAPRKANSTRSRVTSPHVRQYTEKCRSLVVRSTFSKALNFRNHIAVLDATLKVKKLDGEEPSVRHKASLTQEDLSRLEAYFSDVLQANDPIKLTEFVWYVITLHFGLRAREIQVQLRKSDLEFRSDDSGDYFVLNKDFASKNCQGGTKGREFETIGRVQNAHQVKALRLFLSKLNPGVERLFQRARMGFVEEEDATWFQRQVLGKNLLGTMMERISRHANLSQRYTNHCVRATAVTILKKNGVEDSTVCLLTGHKNERSLRSYSKRTPPSVENSRDALTDTLQVKARQAQLQSRRHLQQRRTCSRALWSRRKKQ